MQKEIVNIKSRKIDLIEGAKTTWLERKLIQKISGIFLASRLIIDFGIRVYALRAYGSVDRTKKFISWNSYPNVEAGAEIIVPKKPERRGLTAQAWIAMAKSVATLALVVQSFTK